MTKGLGLTLLVDYGPASVDTTPPRPGYRPLGGMLPAIGGLPVAPDRFSSRLQVPMACLGGEQHAHQSWYVNGELTGISSETGDGFDAAWAEAGDFTFAVISVDDGMPLERQSFHAYQSLLRTVRSRQKPHLLRIWNYVPRINEFENGTERYQLFNRGRKLAYRELGYTLAEGAPAACALGTKGGALQIAILAGDRPAVAIENPRQISSYHYPEQYGADPPIFSRAAWLRQGQSGDMLFVSGTASIVGHRTVHPDDVLAQTQEAVANIRAVLDKANQTGGTTTWTLAGLKGRVYLRHAADYPSVRDILVAAGMTEFCYVQADICRSDLLVEIEAEGQDPNAR